MDSLSLVLVESYPLSQQTSDLIGWEFWDGLYPAWYDDSARVVFLEEFLADRGEYSDLWRSRTWRYLLSASLGTADSVHWEELLGDWLGSCPQDPQAYLSGAVLYIERDSSWSDALELTDRGLSLMESSSIPVGMPPEEWEITGNALEADLLMRRCQALLLQGDPQASLDEIVEVSERMSALQAENSLDIQGLYSMMFPLFLARTALLSEPGYPGVTGMQMAGLTSF